MRNILAVSVLVLIVFVTGLFYGKNFHALIGGIDAEKLLYVIIAAVSTLVAGFGGAYAAYWLNGEKEKERVKKERIGYLARTQAICAIYSQRICEIKTRVIDPSRAKTDSWFSMPAIPYMDIEDDTFDIKELSFLIEMERPSFLIELQLAQDGYLRNMRYIKKRSELITDFIYPHMVKAGHPIGSKPDYKKIEEIVGGMVLYELKGISEAIFEMTDTTISELDKTSDELLSIMKQIDQNSKGLVIQSVS